MSDMNGFDAMPLIKEISPESAIVIFSPLNKEILIRRALRCGALGYVLKKASGKEITEAIMAVHEGKHFLSSQIKDQVIQNYLSFCRDNLPVNKYDLLTKREKQIFRLMVEGLSTAKIGERIFLSPKTVEKHRSSITRKLGTQELVELVKYAIRIGIIDPHSW